MSVFRHKKRPLAKGWPKDERENQDNHLAHNMFLDMQAELGQLHQTSETPPNTKDWQKWQKETADRANQQSLEYREQNSGAGSASHFHDPKTRNASTINNLKTHATGVYDGGDADQVQYGLPAQRTSTSNTVGTWGESAAPVFQPKQPDVWKHPNGYPWHDGNTGHHKDLGKADGAHPHMDAPPKNDQAAGAGVSTYAKFAAPYGTVHGPTKPTNLKHYDMAGKLPDVQKLVQTHGYQVYFAGGKYGKPDLANKNYNTKHLMIYDPTSESGGDFGDTDYTNAWRQTHELAHALTYPHLNSIYGEGRRIGKLGTHRTPQEAMRAVHWEHLAAHKQRELNASIGIHVPDDIFNKEYHCLDPETEALTQRGWIKGFQLKSDDILLTKNIATGELEWQPLLDLKLYPEHEGEVVEFKSRSFSAITTPKHRWMITTNQGKICERFSRDIVCNGDGIHRSGTYTGPISRLSPDEAELLGWFVTDGTYKKNPLVLAQTLNGPQSKYHEPGIYAQICQSRTANPVKSQRIDALLKRLDLSGEVRTAPQLTEGIQIWTLGPNLTKLLREIAPNRKLEIDILLQLGTEALGRLRESMVLGDGSISKKGQVTLVTGRKEQAEAFQILLTLTGSASAIVWRDLSKYTPKFLSKNRASPKASGCWVVTELKRKHVRPLKEHVKKYHAKIGMWCPVVQNTFFVARRLGNVWITGNTVMHDAVHRAVTGQFTEPSQEGFEPHGNHQVPLNTALDMVRNEAMRMGITHPHGLAPKNMKKSEPVASKCTTCGFVQSSSDRAKDSKGCKEGKAHTWSADIAKADLPTAAPALHASVSGFMNQLKTIPKGTPARGKFVTQHMSHAPFLSALHAHPEGKKLHSLLTGYLNSPVNAGPQAGIVATAKSESAVILPKQGNTMSKTYESKEVAEILMKAASDKIKAFELEIQELRKREVGKALIPPHNHNTGVGASAGTEDVAPGRLNPPGKNDPIKKGDLCKGCGKAHGLDKCMGKAELTDAKGNHSSNGISPDSVLPGDKKSKKLPSEGSGGPIEKEKMPAEREGSLDKAAMPPTAKPPSGANMGTKVPTSAPKASPKMAATPAMKSVDKIVAHRPPEKMKLPLKGRDYKAKVSETKTVFEAKPDASMEKGMLADGAKAADPLQASFEAHTKPAVAPKVAMPKPSEHAARAQGHAAALAGEFQPKGPVVSGLELAPKRPGIFGRLNLPKK